ncbi:MAG TPA: hypothetical protein VMS92_24295 [Mycobacterium sp.]|nr:hypothetical protein [Mycobacterium sp.]
MLSAIAIIPSAPVMVPELAASAAEELAGMRQAVFAAAASLPSRWIAVGVGPADEVLVPDRAGTFAGYGVDRRVTLSPSAGDPLTELPLCALIAGWVRDQAKPEALAEVRVYAADHDVEAALAHGRRLRAEIDAAVDPIGVLVVADGTHTLTPAAPGGYDPESIAVQAALDDALARGDAHALTRLPEEVVGRVAYQVLAGLTEARSAKELYRGAPYGVGYFVGVWQP